MWRYGGKYIVGGYWSANALKFKLPNSLDRDHIFDRHQHTRADQYLTRFGFVAEPGGDIGHCTDGGVVEASLETNGAERGIPVRYADAKPDLMA